MKSLDDPRLPLYFNTVDGDYVGAEAGADAAATYTNYSHFADRFFQPDFEAILIDYVETEFLLAEAAQRGWNVGGAAEDYFNNAVTQSILYWEGTQADADTYLAAHPYDAANWKESLGMQKWLALYNRSVEAWAEWRRLDYPVLNVPTGMVYGDIPSRMPYPFNEVKNNLPIEKFATDLIVYYYKRPKVLFFPAIEIVIGWYWDADGCLYFRYNNRSVINTDCKCDYTWEWIKAEK